VIEDEPRLGAVAMLEKPFSYNELMTAVATALQQ
jgi:FixJ family two-component response regulator